MTRLFILLLMAPLAGCMGFEDYYYEEFHQEAAAPTSCGCQTATITPATGVVPTVSQLPAIQTREPDLIPPRR